MRVRKKYCKCGKTLFCSPFHNCSRCRECGTNYRKEKARPHKILYNFIGIFSGYKYCTKCSYIESFENRNINVTYINDTEWDLSDL